jgi:hypothetical protein
VDVVVNPADIGLDPASRTVAEVCSVPEMLEVIRRGA